MKRSLLIAAAIVLGVLMSSAALAGNGHGNGEGHTPVTICHKPGTPAEKTLVVDDDSVELTGHLGHGDSLGACPSAPPTECEEGEILVDGQCVTPPVECEEGQELVEGVCVTPEPPVEPPVVPPVVTPPSNPHDCTFVGADKDGGKDAYGGTNDDCAPFPTPPTPPATVAPPADTPTIVTPLPKPVTVKPKPPVVIVVKPKPDKPTVKPKAKKSTKIVKVSKPNKGLVIITTSDGKKHTAVMGSG